MATYPADHKKAAAAVPARGGSSYRDDPDAVSMHTTRSDYEYDDAPQLPSYSDSVAQDGAAPADDQNSQREDRYRQVYAPVSHFRQGKASSPSKVIGNETSIRMEDDLLDPEKLLGYIESYLRVVPPNPYVRVQGWHWQTVKRDNKKQTDKVYDFDVALGLESYLRLDVDHDWWQPRTVSNSQKTHRGTFRKVRAPGYKQDVELGDQPKPDLMDWCKDFCDTKSALKVFRISRSIAGFNQETIEEALIPLVRSSHYRGHIEISFPTANKNVDIYSPHWVNRARISWVRWIFYLTFLWIFTWPILFFLTKRWSVYHVTWNWSRWADEPERERRVLKYSTFSETQWLDKHRNLILSLVLDRFHGDATDMATDVDVNAAMRRASGELPQSGNANVDAAVNLFRGGLSAWNAVNGRQTGGGWGMDS